MNTERGSAAMVYLVTIFPVEDYDVLTASIKASAEKYARFGVKRRWLLRATDDRREVMSVLEFPSAEHAQAFLQSPEIDVPRFLDSLTLEIYPTFFLGEQTVYMELPPAPEE